MRITRDTPEELRLDYVPWVMAVLFVAFLVFITGFGIRSLAAGDIGGGLGTLFFGGGITLVALAAFTERCQFWADRRRGIVALRRRTAFGQTEVTRPLSAVREAAVEQGSSRRGSDGARSERPVLVMEDGERLPLRESYVSGSAARNTVAAINRWLADGRD